MKQKIKNILQKIFKLLQIFQIISQKVSLQKETKTTFNFLKDEIPRIILENQSLKKSHSSLTIF